MLLVFITVLFVSFFFILFPILLQTIIVVLTIYRFDDYKCNFTLHTRLTKTTPINKLHSRIKIVFKKLSAKQQINPTVRYLFKHINIQVIGDQIKLKQSKFHPSILFYNICPLHMETK